MSDTRWGPAAIHTEDPRRGVELVEPAEFGWHDLLWIGGFAFGMSGLFALGVIIGTGMQVAA